ncbi:serine hydrolase [Mesoflavibacter sp. CH_XMU1404-2]|uniref:serine hydrolase n=1 Tax=Mesoflavibacter sp. CH_XMU1404-2 TaxID=3107766 RepID=UPI00300A8642
MKINLSILLILIVYSVNGQIKDNRLKGLEQEIEQWMNTYKAVGLSVSIVENNKILYNKGFGYRDLDRKKRVNENTVFSIASCTKVFTASLLGILEAEDKLFLKDKPSVYIPKLQFYNSKMDELITIEDLLSHKSGLGDINGTLVLFPEDNRLKVLEKLKYIEPEGKVKESSIYSNMGFTIAGAIAEQVSEESWENLIQNKIFNPLDMSHSFTDLETAKKTNNFSFGYGLIKNDIKQVQFEQYHDYKPAGGIRSTSTDLAHWMLAWLNNGARNNNQVLPKAFVKNARKFHNTREGDYESSLFLTGYGLGWRVETQNGEFKVYHGGNTSGFSTLVVTYPFKNLGITVLTNQDDSILPYVIADIIKNRMLEKEKSKDYPVLVTDIYQTNPVNKSINKEKPPTHQLESYVGEYEHKGYGKIKIVLEHDSLYAIYPDYKFFLEHLHHDIFVMKPLEDISDIMNPEFPVNFRTSNWGEITSFTINLQSKPVEFIKLNE